MSTSRHGLIKCSRSNGPGVGVGTCSGYFERRVAVACHKPEPRPQARRSRDKGCGPTCKHLADNPDPAYARK
ncbi:unnamed protein product, partial [Iphiclides podalirius]